MSVDLLDDLEAGELSVEFEGAEPQELLEWAFERFAPAIAISTAFQIDGVALIDMAYELDPNVEVFSVDTGRLPEETHTLIDRVRATYGIAVDVYAPDAASVEAFVRASGVNAFYASPTLREQCCALRKTHPLARALAGKRAWITGLRRGQSITRRDVAVEEFDAAHGLVKFNPLADWSRDDVWSYVHENGVPYNALHDRGYASIGCAPCTRAVEPGEDERAGRWWWESADRRECGLHRRPAAVPIVAATAGAAA